MTYSQQSLLARTDLSIEIAFNSNFFLRWNPLNAPLKRVRLLRLSGQKMEKRLLRANNCHYQALFPGKENKVEAKM